MAKWGLYCMDCDDGFIFYNVLGSSLPELKILARHMKVVGALSSFKNEISMCSGNKLTLSFGSPHSEINIGWFKKHQEHHVVPRNEYGEIDGTCGAPYGCSHCNSILRCGMQINHDGDHGKSLSCNGPYR